MQEKDLISVIVPVYNVEPYLSECVNSILNQTHKNFEIILVDDGSTDSSGELCDKFAEKDSRIKVIHKDNGGLSSARNAGAEVSHGGYICFIDSDDAVSESYLKTLYENAEKFNADVSMCGFIKFTNNEELPLSSENISFDVNKEEILNRLTEVGTEPAIKITVAWNKLIRKSVADKITFPVGRLHEDEFYINSLLETAETFAETTAELYYYRQRPDSIVGENNQGDLRHFEAVKAFKKRVKIYKRIADKEIYYKMKKAYKDFVVFQCKKVLRAKVR